MPPNMMKAPTGSSLPVIGSSIATVNAGPIPGSTPTAVPSVTPISAQSRLIGVNAIENPWKSPASTSISARPREFPAANEDPARR